MTSVFTSKTPHFFKVILAEAIQDGILGIPVKFAIKYGRQLSSVVKLEVPSGAIWPVELTKSGRKVWLQKGWREFAEHYSVHIGSFVVFRYTGNDHFHVVVFDETATEMDYPLTSSEEADEHISVELPADASASSKRKQEPQEPDSRCPLPRAAKKMRTTGSSIGQVNARPSAQTDFFSCSQRLPRAEKVRAIKRASAFRSTRNPDFMVVMQPSYICDRYRMGIPSDFAKKYLLMGESEVTLCNSAGKTWFMKYYSNAGDITPQAHLLDGWKSFVEDNHLAVGDICIFELIEQQPNMSMKVVVIHPIAEDASKDCSQVQKSPCPSSSPKIKTACVGASGFTTSNHSFRVVMKPSYVHSCSPLHIPKKFAERFLKIEGDMMLRDENGGIWTVEYFKRIGNDGGEIAMFTGKSWRVFAEDNELKAGDECIFELIKEDTNSLNVVIERKLHSSY